MHPIVPQPPRRVVPDLVPAEPDEDAPLTAPRTPRLMVRRTDGTWQLCWVLAWQRSGDRWLVHLAWGERGQIRDGWYVHDPEAVAAIEARPLTVIYETTGSRYPHSAFAVSKLV